MRLRDYKPLLSEIWDNKVFPRAVTKMHGDIYFVFEDTEAADIAYESVLRNSMNEDLMMAFWVGMEELEREVAFYENETGLTPTIHWL